MRKGRVSTMLAGLMVLSCTMATPAPRAARSGQPAAHEASGDLAGPGLLADSVPAAPRSQQWGIVDIGVDMRAQEALVDLGVGWVRVGLKLGEKGWTNKLAKIRQIAAELQRAGVGVWLTLFHRDPTNILENGTVGYAATQRGGFPPADPDRYQALVEKAVGRLARTLGRNGRDPGDWLIVQFGNEVNPRDFFPPDRAVRFWHGTGDQYLDMVVLGHEAVKRIDPNIGVALGGISSGSMEQVQQGVSAAVSWNDRLLAEGNTDWADVHLRHDLDQVGGKVGWVRRRWSGLLAATEIAGPDPRVVTWSEQAQADDLSPRMRTARRRGVDLAFWASLIENPNVAPIFRREGLIERDTWRRKPAFGKYQRLIARESEN